MGGGEGGKGGRGYGQGGYRGPAGVRLSHQTTKRALSFPPCSDLAIIHQPLVTRSPVPSLRDRTKAGGRTSETRIGTPTMALRCFRPPPLSHASRSRLSSTLLPHQTRSRSLRGSASPACAAATPAPPGASAGPPPPQAPALMPPRSPTTTFLWLLCTATGRAVSGVVLCLTFVLGIFLG